MPIFAELRATSFRSESADGSAEIQDPAAKSMGARKLLTSTMRNLGGKQEYSHGCDMVVSPSQKSSPRENDPSEISRIDFDATELERFEVFAGRGVPPVDFHTARNRSKAPAFANVS